MKIFLNSTSIFRTRILAENSMWLEETTIRTMHIGHPEVNFILFLFIIIFFLKQRNLYNKIFGGYLMRKSFDLAWTTASLFA